MNNLEAIRALCGTNVPAFRESVIILLQVPKNLIVSSSVDSGHQARRIGEAFVSLDNLWVTMHISPRSLWQESKQPGLHQNTICSQVSNSKQLFLGKRGL
jgi:hypothetical protein